MGLVVAGGLFVLVWLVVAVILLRTDTEEAGPIQDEDTFDVEPGAFPTTPSPQLPPSERSDDESAPQSSTPEGRGYRNLRCVFLGTALLDPGIDPKNLVGSPQRMTLSEGARFDCTSSDPPTAGDITLDVTFDDMTKLDGAAAGGGRITWRSLPPGEAAPSAGPPVSSTRTEIELRFPEIVVWVTVLDGPYAGFRGRVVLNRWEVVYDDAGRIVEVRFEPTDFDFNTA